MGGFIVFLGFAALVFALSVIVKGVIVVRQSEVIIIEKLGSYSKTLTNGLNLIIPFLEAPRKILWKEAIQRADGKMSYYTMEKTRIDLRETVYDFPRQNVITRDNVTIEINALLYFQIVDPRKAVYEISNFSEAIEKLTQTTLRNVIGELDLDQTLVSRDTVNSKLREILDEATDKWGVKVNRVELQDIIPPKEIREAMEKQMKAERDKRASILTAEGDKRAQILNAEGSRDAEVARAEGEKMAKILQAEGIAEARLKVIEAEAEALKKIANAIEGEDASDPVKYLIAVKYIEAFEKISNGNDSKVVFMPYEASAVMSSVGTIKELFDKTNK